MFPFIVPLLHFTLWLGPTLLNRGATLWFLAKATYHIILPIITTCTPPLKLPSCAPATYYFIIFQVTVSIIRVFLTFIKKIPYKHSYKLFVIENLTQALLSSHHPTVFHPHADVLVPAVIATVADTFYKISSEALLVLQILVKILRPLGTMIIILTCSLGLLTFHSYLNGVNLLNTCWKKSTY